MHYPSQQEPGLGQLGHHLASRCFKLGIQPPAGYFLTIKATGKCLKLCCCPCSWSPSPKNTLGRGSFLPGFLSMWIQPGASRSRLAHTHALSSRRLLPGAGGGCRHRGVHTATGHLDLGPGQAAHLRPREPGLSSVFTN